MPPEPWRTVLHEIDKAASETIELHCIGGFVVQVAYGLNRSTVDLNFLSVVPPAGSEFLERIAGKGSSLHHKYRVFVQRVSVLDAYPENYADRLAALFRGTYTHLKLYALEPHDLALTKLGRDWPVDRADIRLLARAGLITSDVLTRRYRDEMRSYLANPDRYDLTLRLWTEIIDEVSRPAEN
jgi:hypothetical protein